MATAAEFVLDDLRPPTTSMSPQEWQMRVEITACYRLIHHYGWTAQVYNHITGRIPGTEHILINPFGMMYDEIRASDLVKIDLEGNKLEASDYPVNKAGYVIHSAIHAARPDLNCVIHTHSHNSVAISTIDTRFIPLTQEGCQFFERVGYHEYEGIALDESERERLVADLGETNHTLVLYNHGIVTTGDTPAAAFVRLYHFENAAGVQLRAHASGVPLKLLSPEVMAHTRGQFEGGSAQAGASMRYPEWPASLRMLDRIDPSWRT
jgi:ribulose-5-phosphate 4-epimerase/fuculose-1-phosphate aldolase